MSIIHVVIYAKIAHRAVLRTITYNLIESKYFYTIPFVLHFYYRIHFLNLVLLFYLIFKSFLLIYFYLNYYNVIRVN